ncbi:hypothetical protein [Streptomyces sp. BH104]|uniref:hypothetical protein n=1 Tax=Streptomyces sp. BH104 TaxID=3410407 RepID=UPI003BB717CB
MTDASDATTFPSDLLAAQKRLAELYAQVAAFPKARNLPWSVEPLDGWKAVKSAHADKVEREGRPDSPGWSQEDQDAYAKLWDELAEKAQFVQCHAYWSGIEGSKLVKQRMLLKNDPAALPTPVETAAVEGEAPAVEDLAQAV